MKNMRKWLLLLLLALTLMGKEDDKFEPNFPIGDETESLSVENWN